LDWPHQGRHGPLKRKKRPRIGSGGGDTSSLRHHLSSNQMSVFDDALECSTLYSLTTNQNFYRTNDMGASSASFLDLPPATMDFLTSEGGKKFRVWSSTSPFSSTSGADPTEAKAPPVAQSTIAATTTSSLTKSAPVMMSLLTADNSAAAGSEGGMFHSQHQQLGDKTAAFFRNDSVRFFSFYCKYLGFENTKVKAASFLVNVHIPVLSLKGFSTRWSV